MQSNPQVPWTEEQWARVNQAIQEEAQRVRVAAKFLPLYGPLPADTDFVRKVDIPAGAPLTVNDTTTIELSTLQLQLHLRGAQLRPNIIRTRPRRCPVVPPVATGNDLVVAVTNAIGDLETKGYFGPFAVALSQSFFGFTQQPNPTQPQVTPQDQIVALLGGGSLLRCSAIPNGHGVVVALGGEPIELVVATDMSVQFLQLTTDPIYVFRVYEKLALRIKSNDAVATLT